MSYTTLLSINLEKRTCEYIKEYSNSHGSAPVVWGVFCEKYLNQSKYYWLHNKGDELWKLYKDNSIPIEYRAVLMMAFDTAIIVKSDFMRAVNDIRKFCHDFLIDYVGENHWPTIANDIESLADDSKILSIGIHQTSVTDNPFNVWREETEDYILSDEIYNLYEGLDNIIQ